MSNQSSRFIANQKEKRTIQNDQHPLLKNSKFVDISAREGRIAKTPYSIAVNQYSKGSEQNSQNARLELSQNSRESLSIINKIKAIPQKLHNFVGNMLFGSQAYSQESHQSNKRRRKKYPRGLIDNESDAEEYARNEHEQMDGKYLCIILILVLGELEWNNKFKDNDDVVNTVSFSFQQTPQYNSLVQSKSEKQTLRQQPNVQMNQSSYQVPRNQVQVLSQGSTSSINFDNAYLMPSNQSNTDLNRQFLSMWSKYNQRQYKQSLIIPDKPRKSRMINCVRIIAEKTHKTLITADNKRQLLNKNQSTNNRQRIYEPKAIKKQAQIKLSETQGVRRKRFSEEALGVIQQKSTQQNVRQQYRKVTENEDQIMQSQTFKKKDTVDTDRIKQGVMKVITLEDMKRLNDNTKQIRSLYDKNQSDELIEQIVEEKAKQIAPKILMNEIKELEKKKKNFIIATVKDNQGSNSQMITFMQQLQDQQLQEQKKYYEQQLDELKKLLNYDNIKELLQETIQKELMKEKDSQIQSQLEQKSLISESQSQNNLLTPGIVEEMKNQMKQLQELMYQHKEVIMQSQDTYNKQNSNKSNISNISLQDLISDSPKQESTQAKFGNSNFLNNKKNNTDNLESIKEEKGSQEEKKVGFKIELNVKKEEDKQNRIDDKSPSFGDRTDDKLKNSESFISECISTPESKSPKAQDNKLPNLQFKFAPAGDNKPAGAQPVIKFNMGGAQNVNPQGSNQGSNTTQESAKPINPFLANKITPIPISNTTVTGGAPQQQVSNPFINPNKANNPFLSGNPAPTTVPITNSNVSNPFSTNNNANTSTGGFNNQFKSPFSTNSNTSAPAFAFQSNNNNQTSSSTPTQGNPFAQNNMQPQNQTAMNQGNNNTGNNPFANSNQNKFNNNSSAPAMNNNPFANKPAISGGNPFQSSNPSGFNNQSRPPMQPFSNATNFQPNNSSPNQFQSNQNQNSSSNNNIQRSSFNAGQSGNPFQSNSNQNFNSGTNNTSGRANPFVSGGSSGSNSGGAFNSGYQGNNMNTNSNNNDNGAPGFNLGRKVTQQQSSNDDGDDLFATGGRKMFKAKRNV